ncbi:hypothetical protein ZWY2020_034548 [Hordeum vulgare]|nr:hypothetical protein ZWY2020_034548 [Hordeum vulgare]
MANLKAVASLDMAWILIMGLSDIARSERVIRNISRLLAKVVVVDGLSLRKEVEVCINNKCLDSNRLQRRWSRKEANTTSCWRSSSLDGRHGLLPSSRGKLANKAANSSTDGGGGGIIGDGVGGDSGGSSSTSSTSQSTSSSSGAGMGAPINLIPSPTSMAGVGSFFSPGAAAAGGFPRSGILDAWMDRWWLNNKAGGGIRRRLQLVTQRHLEEQRAVAAALQAGNRQLAERRQSALARRANALRDRASLGRHHDATGQASPRGSSTPRRGPDKKRQR